MSQRTDRLVNYLPLRSTELKIVLRNNVFSFYVFNYHGLLKKIDREDHDSN